MTREEYRALSILLGKSASGFARFILDDAGFESWRTNRLWAPTMAEDYKTFQARRIEEAINFALGEEEPCPPHTTGS